MIENSYKTLLNFSQLQCTYLGKNSFQYHKGLVRKKEIEKWLLRTLVQCTRDVFYGRRKVDLMKTTKVNAYIMHIFGKIELLSIHAT